MKKTLWSYQSKSFILQGKAKGEREKMITQVPQKPWDKKLPNNVGFDFFFPTTAVFFYIFLNYI